MKKSLKKLLVGALCAITCASAVACGAPTGGNSSSSSLGQSNSSSGGGEVIDKVVTYDTYQSYWMKQHDSKTMPIAAFISPPVKVGEYSQNFITDEQYRILAESGINTAYGLTESLPQYNSDVAKALNYCDKYGISYVACVSSIHTMKTANQIRQAMENPLTYGYDSLGGVIIRDEPSYHEFAGCRQAKDLAHGLLKDDELLYHSNLFPFYASAHQLYNRATGKPELPSEGYSYEQYVNDYLEIYDPQILSYDYYPLQGINTSDISQGYFENMSIIMNKARANGIPFWVYIQACTFSPTTARIPTDAEIQWLVGSSLAYGCKGIQYFTYFLPNDTNETFIGSCIDRNGNKTQIYNYVQKANKHIIAVDEILMHSLFKGVKVTGSTPCPVPEIDQLSDMGSLRSVSAKHALTGRFDHDGRDVYYSLNNSITQSDSMTFNLSGSKGYYIVGEKKTAFEGSVSVTLPAGESILIVTE